MSIEEFSFEDDGGASESWAESSEWDAQRARDDSAKAQQVRTQIKQIQQQNKQFADMLSLLLQLINDEKVLTHVFAQLTQHHIPIPAIFAQFLPVIRHQIDTSIYAPLYGDLRTMQPDQETVSSMVTWLQHVRSASAALQGMPLSAYTQFAARYLNWMWLVAIKDLSPEDTKALLTSIAKELQ